jgi:hypothetical protein
VNSAERVHAGGCQNRTSQAILRTYTALQASARPIKAAERALAKERAAVRDKWHALRHLHNKLAALRQGETAQRAQRADVARAGGGDGAGPSGDGGEDAEEEAGPSSGRVGGVAAEDAPGPSSNGGALLQWLTAA